MKIKKGMQGRIINAPPSMHILTDSLEENGHLSPLESDLDFIICFATTKQQVSESAHLVFDLKIDAIYWLVYPKKGVYPQCEISKYSGIDALINLGYKPNSFISVDEYWTALRFRNVCLIKSSKKDVTQINVRPEITFRQQSANQIKGHI